MSNYDIPNGQVTGDIAYKHAHRNETFDYTELFTNIRLYNEKVKERERKEFLELLLDDEVIRNNRALQEKYMELHDRYIGK